MKWILSLIVLALFFPVAVLAEVPTRGLPLASDRHRHKPQAKEADCCDASYEWVACRDPGQVALFKDGVQVGNFRYSRNNVSEAVIGNYYSFNGEEWAKRPMPYGSIPEGAPTPPKQGDTWSNSFTPSGYYPAFSSPLPSDTFWQDSGASGRNRILGNGGFRGGFFRSGRRGGGGCSGGG